jgi:hypothetical protein
MSKYGHCIVENHDGVTVVKTADPIVLVSKEFLQNLSNSHVSRDGNDLTFGTSGRGLGVVTYRVVGDEFQNAVAARRVA